MRTAPPASQQNRRPNKHPGAGMGGNKPSGGGSNPGGGGGGQNAGKPPMRKSRNKPHNKPKPPAPVSET